MLFLAHDPIPLRSTRVTSISSFRALIFSGFLGRIPQPPQATSLQQVFTGSRRALDTGQLGAGGGGQDDGCRLSAGARDKQLLCGLQWWRLLAPTRPVRPARAPSPPPTHLSPRPRCALVTCSRPGLRPGPRRVRRCPSAEPAAPARPSRGRASSPRNGNSASRSGNARVAQVARRGRRPRDRPALLSHSAAPLGGFPGKEDGVGTDCRSREARRGLWASLRPSYRGGQSGFASGEAPGRLPRNSGPASAAAGAPSTPPQAQRGPSAFEG